MRPLPKGYYPRWWTSHPKRRADLHSMFDRQQHHHSCGQVMRRPPRGGWRQARRVTVRPRTASVGNKASPSILSTHHVPTPNGAKEPGKGASYSEGDPQSCYLIYLAFVVTSGPVQNYVPGERRISPWGGCCSFPHWPFPSVYVWLCVDGTPCYWDGDRSSLRDHQASKN